MSEPTITCPSCKTWRRSPSWMPGPMTLKVGLEREIKEFDRQIKEARKAAVAALTLEEKLAGQKRIKALEAERSKRRRALFDAQDEIDRRREQLIAEIEGKLEQRMSQERLFSVQWKIV